MDRRLTRRGVLARAAVGGALALGELGCRGGERRAANRLQRGPVPRRPFWRTGVAVSALALGGHHLGLVPDEEEAVRIVQEAVDAGITFLVNAREYHCGRVFLSDQGLHPRPRPRRRHAAARGVAPPAARQGIAPIGMKSLGGGRIVEQHIVNVHEALRYAMSLPVATSVVGIDSREVPRQDLAVAGGFQPMSVPELAG